MTMTTPTLASDAHDGDAEDSDDKARPGPRRPSFSAAYKARILDEYEAATDSGSKGALLRREGLYSSHIVVWRRARQAGATIGLSPKQPRGRDKDKDKELETLRKSNARLADSSPNTNKSWPSREKHRSSWRNCSPRARTQRCSKSRDRGLLL